MPTPTQWQVQSSRLAALAYLTEFNTMRNRLAHHEPVWKFASVQDPTLGQLPGTVDVASSLGRFSRLLVQLDDGLRSLNSDLAKDLATSSWRKRIDFLVSGRGVERYRTGKHVAGPAISPAKFKRTFGQVIRANGVVVIGGGTQYRGLFTPG